MSRKSGILFSTAAFLVFICALVYFFAGLAMESANGERTAGDEFVRIGRNVITAGYTHAFMDEEFVRTVSELVNNTPSAAAVVLTGPEGTEYAYPVPSPFIVSDSAGDLRISATSPIVKVFTAPLNMYETRNVTLTAAFYTMPPSAIYYYGRNAFLIILAMTLIALIVIISDNLMAKKAPADSKTEESAEDSILKDSAADINSEDTDFSFEDNAALPDEIVVPDDIVFPEEDVSMLADSNESADEAYADDSYIDDPAPVAAMDELPPDPHESDDVIDGLPAEPAGLFSPVTGLGWESYLETRLDAEISRAAASEEDIALLIIRVTDMRYTDLASRKIVDILLNYFKFKDLLFEYSGDGFACILQNGNIDDTMRLAEKLFADITPILEAESPLFRAAVGISTRTLRLIPAMRLISEAVQAVNKAFEEENMPIVAFRADPEKYRQFMSEGLN